MEERYSSKILIIGNDNDSIYYTSRSQFDSEHDKDEDKKNPESNNIDIKPPNAFDYLKSLNQEAKDLMVEREDADDDIDIHKLVFTGSNREKFSFNIFRKTLNFLLAIYNGKISL